MEESTATFRNYKDEYGEKYLIIGEVIAKWSAQDYLTFDEIPYIGKTTKKIHKQMINKSNKKKIKIKINIVLFYFLQYNIKKYLGGFKIEK